MKSQSLHKVSKLLDALERTEGEPGDLNSTLQHIAKTAQNFFTADEGVIFAINPITNRFIASLTSAGDSLEENVLYEQSKSDGLTQQVLKQGVLLVKDLKAMPEYQSVFTRLEDIHAFVALALLMKHRQKPLGVLYLSFRKPQQFTADDHELFQLFAKQASYILQETWLLRRYQEVARIGQEINHELATEDILFEKLQKHVVGILDTRYVFLLAVYQPQTNTVDLYMEDEGRSAIRYAAPLEGAFQYVIETQKTMFIPHMRKEAEHLRYLHAETITGTGSKESLIFVPLVLRGVPLGVLSIQHAQPNVYNQEDLFILQLLATHIALALHNIRLYSSLSQLNETGQFLTLHLDSEQVLQTTAEKIQDATQADLVILYPYEPLLQRFLLPPLRAGTFLDPTFPLPRSPRPDDISMLTLRHGESIFAEESSTIYATLHIDIQIQQGSFQQRENIRSTAALPLQAGDKLVGVLFVNFRKPQRFNSPRRLFIEGLAHYAAIVIKNAQAFGTLSQRRVQELEILQNIDRELSRTVDLESVLDTLLRLAHKHVPAEEASILLYNPQQQVLETMVAVGRHAEVSRKQIISLQETKGITGWVLKQKKPARVENIHRDQPWKDLHLPVAIDTISELDVPLLDGDEVIGVINFESTREGAFHQEDQDFLVTLAGQAVLAIKKAQAYEREKRFAAEAQVLNQISKQITSQLDPTYVFNLILQKALELTHSTRGNLMLYDPDQNDLWMAAEHGVVEDKKGRRQSLDQGVVGYAARTRELLNVDLSQSPWNSINLDYFHGTLSELAVPLLAGNDLYGVLNIESSTPNNFSESDERLMLGLADLAVIAVQNTQAYEREKHFAAEAQVLNQISKEITSQLDLIYVFDLILEKGLELTRSTLGSLHLYDPDLNELHMVAERGVAEGKRNLHQKLGQGIVGYVAKNKHLLNVKDVSQEPWNKIYEVFIPRTRSELAAPMFAGNLLRGVLNIESSSLNHFSESDERLLQGLADLAVVALQNAERYEKAEREAQRFQLLYQAGQELSKITELAQLDQAYDAILQIAVEHSQSQVVIRRYDEETEELVLVRASLRQDSPLFSRMNLNEGLNGQVAREQRMIVIYDTNNLPPGVSVHLSDPTIQALVIIPMKFKDRYYGNLGFGHEEIGYFRGTDINFYEGLAQQLASTIYRLETAQARQEAEEMSWIGEIAFSLTHRLDNALGLVGSYVGDIRTGLEKQGITDMVASTKLENIQRAARAVLEMSRTLKDTVAKSGESVTGEPVVIQPRALLEESYVQAAPSLPSNTQMNLQIDPDVASVRVIPSLVADILDNLVTNAIQAMPKGGTITLKARNAGRLVALEVVDTGIGILPQNQAKIFGLFYSTKQSSGFGLWSARRYARKCGGDLKVESQPGQGATFTLLLPRNNGEAEGAS